MASRSSIPGHAKEYLKLIPHEKLLFEIDYSPEHAGLVPKGYERALADSAALIAASWNVSVNKAVETLAAASEAIFRQTRGEA